MMISTKGRYALRVMIDLAQNDTREFISLKDVAERQDVSMKYLEMIVSLLHKGKMLESQRGKSGGYRLARKPAEYTIESILTLTEGTLAPVTCVDNGAKNCDRAAGCITLPLWKKLDDVISQYLDSVTLEDLLNGNV
jgi:Rrf2 family protein